MQKWVRIDFQKRFLKQYKIYRKFQAEVNGAYDGCYKVYATISMKLLKDELLYRNELIYRKVEPQKLGMNFSTEKMNLSP